MKKINNSSTSKALFKNTGIIAIGQVSTKIVNFFAAAAVYSTADYRRIWSGRSVDYICVTHCGRDWFAK